MANILEKENRRVIPNFRSLLKSSKYGDFEFLNFKVSAQDLNNIHYEQQKDQWNKLKTIGHAADLISCGIVINPEDPVLKEVAKYIVKSKKASKSLLSVTHDILMPSENQNEEINYLKLFISKYSFKSVYDQISYFKTKAISMPKNPLNYVELSRLYLILGQKEKAALSMQKALFLDPNNRFILRSAARLYTDFEEYDIPLHYLSNSSSLLKDPWLVSAEIALSSLSGKNSKLIKKGRALIDSNNYSTFSLTELCSSIGTIDLINGKIRQAKALFQKALEKPNDNSLAQVEWASKRDLLFDLNPNNFKTVDKKCEALTLMYYHKGDWKEAIKNAEQWFIDSPFSKRSVLMGTHISLAYLDDKDKAIEFSKAGLVSHPNDPQLINNLSYSLALKNKTKEARDYLELIKNKTIKNSVTKICIIATRGLLNYREGNTSKGRELYLKAIDNTKYIAEPVLYYTAILNFAREEIRVGSSYIENVMNLVSKIPDKSSSKPVMLLKSNVIKSFEKFKKTRKYKRLKINKNLSE